MTLSQPSYRVSLRGIRICQGALGGNLYNIDSCGPMWLARRRPTPTNLVIGESSHRFSTRGKGELSYQIGRRRHLTLAPCFHCRTWKEACSDATGVGSPFVRDQLGISADPRQPAELKPTRPDPDERLHRELRKFEVAPALAAEGWLASNNNGEFGGLKLNRQSSNARMSPKSFALSALTRTRAPEAKGN
jgi:hypothetical protein